MEQELQNSKIGGLFGDAVNLLKKLIQTPSFSSDEGQTAELIATFLKNKGIRFERSHNNIWAKNRYFDPIKPTILLNSHHDTVKPNLNYSNDPFDPIEEDGKLYGLGSNDAGASLVSLLACFLHFYDRKDLKYNIILSATAEEEISGEKGVVSIIEQLGKIEFALVGEPTEMKMAIAEKALLVIDCTAKGTASHAAHPNFDKVIYKAIEDINWIKSYEFPKRSPWLGNVKMTATVIHSGELHNQVPSECKFTIDVRVTEQYSTIEVFETIKSNLKSDAVPRSLQRNSSAFQENHEFVKAGLKLGSICYGSPTSSDQALLPYPSLKMGPGLSTRSHSADEFIYLHEIKEGIKLYIEIFELVIT